ncbi:hypothetical protein LCGC14_0626140 [marine sediment metagenome]|uniref:Adenylosuccinate synthetase n=1 Tax=marine sediment metagenome TaxID=412755 RepID=A0A0F9R8E7_9ZZZZ
MNNLDLVHPGKVSVLVGGQFGSEAKGAVAAWIAYNASEKFTFAATNAGAQAGHTTVMDDGASFVCYHLPTTSIIQNIPAYLTAGSIIDVELLMKEMDDLAFHPNHLHIHPQAAVITERDKEEEKSRQSMATKISSTQKGVGAALALKVRRFGQPASDVPDLATMIGHRDEIVRMLNAGASCMLEVPQGFGLSLNHGGEYPYCTSRDCYVTSAMSDAGFHPSLLHKTVMVVRTFPIRVGNIDGGHSGPSLQDQREISFKDLGVEPEYTTVTKRMRRIFTFSHQQYRRALTYNRPDVVVLTFCNYLKDVGTLNNFVNQLRSSHVAVGVNPQLVFQYGPKMSDFTPDIIAVGSVIETQEWAWGASQ